MQYSIGVEYALHCLIYMVDIPSGKPVGIKDLATFQGVSETYLSKVFSKLRKTGIVRSIPGVKGGYELARSPGKITFWDIIEAVEGLSPLFQCVEIRQKELLLDKNNLPEEFTSCPCLIKVVMEEAEDQMRQYLKTKTLAWLHEQYKFKVPEGYSKATAEWFIDTKSR
ncbi:MAG: Rrf2 family transcriptional regulator [Chitinophagaceae bacterium]|nr:Rrf2 family transcriptional regulator [Chitinophagaceae bacterium]